MQSLMRKREQPRNLLALLSISPNILDKENEHKHSGTATAVVLQTAFVHLIK